MSIQPEQGRRVYVQTGDALLSTQALSITGRLLINGEFEKGNLVGVTFNPAGTVIARTTSDGYVQLWSASTYRLLWQFRFPQVNGSYQQVNNVAFSPDGRIMAVTCLGGPWLFNVARPAHPVHLATLHVQAPTSATVSGESPVAVSPNGNLIAFATQTGENAYAAKLWSVAAGKVITTVPSGPAGLTSIAFSPDGTMLAVSAT
ncbi:MAG TPA: hypothetical protein VHZ03_09840 [Trebonia sp.]|jgi:WD40 repeat protein|nr:hypothetical protein [Trebonia sp.]